MKTTESTNEESSGVHKDGHTAGPWNVEHPFGEPEVYIAGPNTGLIAKLYKPDTNLFNVDKPVSIDANARLIAAAPELLEALKKIYAGDTMAGREHWTLADVIQEHYKIAREAIHKAEGK